MKVTHNNYKHTIRDDLFLSSHATKRDLEFLPRLTGVDDRFIGTRLPEIKRLAEELIKDNKPEILIPMIIERLKYHEEKMLIADLLGLEKDIDKQLELLDMFLPYIKSWDISDSMVCRLRSMIRKHRVVYKKKTKQLLYSENPWYIRVGLVMAMDYYKDEDVLDMVIDAIKKIDTKTLESEYYLRMGIAWNLATFYLTFPDKTIDFLNKPVLDLWTRKKSITKMIESRQIDEYTKKELKKIRESLI